MSELVMKIGSINETPPFYDEYFPFKSEGLTVVEARKQLLNLLKRGTSVIWLDAPISRSQRIKEFNYFMSEDESILIAVHQVFRTYEEFCKLHPEMSEEEAFKYYTGVQPPKTGVDCHNFFMGGTEFFKKTAVFNSIVDLATFVDNECVDCIKPEVELNFQPHDSIYHKESIDEHIDSCINLSTAYLMRLLALFHDLGKGFTKREGKFIGHENLGATYLANAFWVADEEYSEVYELVSVVLAHMVCNLNEGKLPEKYISRHKLDPGTVDLLQYFSKNIDKEGRIVNG